MAAGVPQGHAHVRTHVHTELGVTAPTAHLAPYRGHPEVNVGQQDHPGGSVRPGKRGP